MTYDCRRDHDRHFHQAESRLCFTPCPTSKRRRSCTPLCSAPSPRPTSPTSSVLRSPVSTSGSARRRTPARNLTGVAYWHVPDIEAKLAEVTAAGATVTEPAHDVGGGRLVASFTDLDDNVLGLIEDR